MNKQSCKCLYMQTKIKDYIIPSSKFANICIPSILVMKFLKNTSKCFLFHTPESSCRDLTFFLQCFRGTHRSVSMSISELSEDRRTGRMRSAWAEYFTLVLEYISSCKQGTYHCIYVWYRNNVPIVWISYKNG